MILTDEHIEFISNELIEFGISSVDLREEMLDHICTDIELNSKDDFPIAYRKAITKYGLENFIRKGKSFEIYKNVDKCNIIVSKKINITGILILFIIVTGLTIKFLHLKYGGIILFTGFLLFNFIYLPAFFIQRYNKYTS